ncbi:single-stranded-DNA-specific exonuclease RecJ [Emcibacter sp.]|uniref:single-stranded-DNA-specific exonuclease RecJ n=1 Tax=Emcibacter sp. TaxID=1979954 RepID=UPI002AA8B57E|nr:single-stranded-DNA-specific exonuclease RecJ [Emcibacter sp.]
MTGTFDTEQSEYLLGVEKSVTGRAWKVRPAEYREVQAISQQNSVSEIVARVVVGRGVSIEEAPQFLNPTLRDSLPDPSVFRDMDLACQRLADAIINNDKVAVFGDYDVDGATSSALFRRFFTAQNRDLLVYIPDRMKEGYGPNAEAFLKLKEQGAQLVVTVDCGIVSFDPLEIAADAGLEVIVVDHHQAEPALPKAVAVVNPNRLDEVDGYGQLAAIGVSFLVIVGLSRELRKRGWYDEQGLNEPDLMSWLDLVALGTICDVVPLKGINRALVSQGLKIMARRGNMGINALMDVCGTTEAPGTYHAGFLIGPRVNAGGRVGRCETGYEILSTNDSVHANMLARELHQYNAERQAIEMMVLEQAKQQVAAKIGPGGMVPPVIIAHGDGWHPGVIGIVAGRLKELYQRPTFVIGIDEHGIGKGSGRSIPGVDLGAAVTAARQQDLLINGGGHAMAAGLTVSGELLEEFEEFLAQRLGQYVDEALQGLSLKLDGALAASAVRPELVEELNRVGPYGQGNAQPRFALSHMKVTYADVVGQDHVKCSLQGRDGVTIKGMAFRSAEQPLGQLILGSRGQMIHVAGTLKNNSWNGRTTAEIFIDDAAPVR